MPPPSMGISQNCRFFLAHCQNLTCGILFIKNLNLSSIGHEYVFAVPELNKNLFSSRTSILWWPCSRVDKGKALILLIHLSLNIIAYCLVSLLMGMGSFSLRLTPPSCD